VSLPSCLLPPARDRVWGSGRNTTQLMERLVAMLRCLAQQQSELW
jgi:hypothetical protein